MKNIGKMLALVSMTVAAVSCGPKNVNKTEESTVEAKPKTLVLYYSQTSNTQAVAKEIANRLGADIEEIVAMNPYDGDFNATIQRCIEEREQGVTPEIQPIKVDLSKYDLFFIGYPVWFGTYAPPVATFLKQVDLSGKKIVPFCTFGSGGLESSAKDLAEAQPKAEVLEGYGVRAARLEAASKELDLFLKAGGFIKGDYTPLEPFGETHPVSDEESAVFDAAVGDYPMMHAKATQVALRNIPEGKEYLFTAVDLPREERSDMPPAGEMKVYVTVAEGQTPVFTKVIR